MGWFVILLLWSRSLPLSNNITTHPNYTTTNNQSLLAKVLKGTTNLGMKSSLLVLERKPRKDANLMSDVRRSGNIGGNRTRLPTNESPPTSEQNRTSATRRPEPIKRKRTKRPMIRTNAECKKDTISEKESLNLGKCVVVAVKVTPAGLNQGNLVIGEVMDGFLKEIRVGNEVSVEDEDVFSLGRLHSQP